MYNVGDVIRIANLENWLNYEFTIEKIIENRYRGIIRHVKNEIPSWCENFAVSNKWILIKAAKPRVSNLPTEEI